MFFKCLGMEYEYFLFLYFYSDIFKPLFNFFVYKGPSYMTSRSGGGQAKCDSLWQGGGQRGVTSHN